ncbi:hypothetical protein [Actinoplanes rectilineatus]|uniref:AbiJ-related protein n=1 Tax=Actinoplanes rectilineatus TaxID=113571 RepID=UPI0005F2E8E6|nr:hypothetical protein [Actinoplanes rectilineatus]
MADQTDTVQLREVVSNVLHDICQNVSHPRLDGELIRFGLPASSAGESKAERAESSIAIITVDQLPAIAQRLLDGYEFLGAPTRNRIQDLLWAGTGYPVPKRIRRDIARRLPLTHLVDHPARFRGLLANLFVLDDIPLAALVGRDRSLGGRIDQHVFNNDDWTPDQLFDELGAIDASDRRFALLLEGMVSSETIPDEQAQRDLVAAINPPLADAGLELRETGTIEGYPVFTLLKARSRTGRPKNLIFASPVKPDLRLSDAIDNDIEIVSNADAVLVYDRPIGADGVRWRDLQVWWRDTRATDTDEQAKIDLYRRLRQSLPGSSPPQQLLFDLYHDIHRDRVHDLPALLPEVWLHWDPQTVKQRGAAALLNLRMDFLLLVPGGGRIVLEVDGQTHYAIDGRADPSTYARTMTGSRNLTLAGYEVHRFGAHDLRDHDRARSLLTQFFADLFRRHQVSTD